MAIPNLSKREKLILYSCIGIIVLSILYAFILEPFVSMWSELNREIESARLKLRKSTEIVKRRLEIAERYKNLSGYIKAQRGSDEEEIAQLLSEIEKLANTSNIRITDIKPKAARISGYHKIYVVEVESEGNISTFTKFIYEIQNSPQLLKVKKLSLNMKGITDNLLKADIVITKILP